MVSGNCSIGWTITSQDDVDLVSNELISCTNGTIPSSTESFPWVRGPPILLRSATGNITFPGHIWADNITVTESDTLESLNITGFYGVREIDIARPPTMQELHLPSEEIGHPTIQIQIHSDLQNQQATEIRTWNVYGDRILDLNIDNAGDMIFLDVTQMSTLAISNATGMEFPALYHADTLSITGDPNDQSIYLGFQNLSSVISIDTTFIGYETLLRYNFQVLQNMTMRRFSVNQRAIDTTGGGTDSIMIPSIGGNLTILDALDVQFSFANLTAISGDFVFADSNNGSLSFKNLAEVSAIWMQNNTNVTLPGNMDSLGFANDIYLNGHIDTSTGGNIFPSLKLVRGSVVVEAWNGDFNCSKLVRQRDDGVINHLYCNGTDNGNSTEVVAPGPSIIPDTPSNTGLPMGARAGIGVGAAAILLSLVGAFLYFQRKLKALAKNRPVSIPEPTEPHLDGNEIREAEGTMVFPRSFPLSEATAVRSPVEVDAPRGLVEIG